MCSIQYLNYLIKLYSAYSYVDLIFGLGVKECQGDIKTTFKDHVVNVEVLKGN